MQGTVDGFSYGLVTPVVAYLMACLGGALGLRCTTRSLLVANSWRMGWLALGSAAIGSGIWTMHFIAMMGFSVEGVPIRYDPLTTFASLGVAILMVGIGVLIVGYKGAGPAVQDLLGGQLDAVATDLPSALQLVKAGRLRAIGTVFGQRVPSLPDVPTMAQLKQPEVDIAPFTALMAPKDHVYAFEPGAYALSILKPMVRLQGRGRISIDPIAFGAAPGKLTLSTPIKKSGSLGFGLSHLGPSGVNGGGEGGNVLRHEVAVETVDRYVASKGLKRLDLIKADIEGWEMQLLRGATDTLATLRPIVFVEAVDFYLARAGDSRPALWAFMRERGYRPHRLEPGLPPFEPEADGDVVWVPEEKALHRTPG